MSDDKINIVENITDLEDLEKIVIKILTESGIENIETKSPIITGNSKSALGNSEFLFFLTTNYLGKNFEGFSEIKDTITHKIKIKSFNSIYVVSSKNITNGFQEKLKRSFQNFHIEFWDRERVVEKIEEKYADYWRHNDQNLLGYEKAFEEEINNDWSIQKIKQFKGAHEKLLKIFIEPKLQHKVNDFESQKKAFVKIGLDKLKDLRKPVILEGEPGIGKTRLLKQIGLEFINSNTSKSGNKYLPIFINNVNLIESREHQSDLVDIKKAIQNKLSLRFNGESIAELSNRYTLIFLIDSIDEFNKENQEKVLLDLKSCCNSSNRIFLATRFQDYSSLNGISEMGKCEEVYVEKFNDQQIKLFLSLYFKGAMGKAANLLDSLKENYIIQRLPITPLNLSLISILYEENNFEIPATITDIYDNFSNLLLGRSLPDSRFEFFDITIRERILSVYALELLERGERNYMTKQEFYDFFKSFFQPIRGTINIELLPEALDFIINNTGILVMQDDKYVKFMHESYMEYYASREIFNYRREQYEKKLIDQFLEVSWQYTAIFYAGRTKQMDDFLNSVIERTKKSSKAIEFYKSIHGLGYLSQALYMTNDEIRKEAVLSSLTYTIEIYEWMKKMGSDEKLFFKNLSVPLTAVINSMMFFDSFNSITIKRPLELAFDELFTKLLYKAKEIEGNIDSTIAYKLFTIALTLASSRFGSLDKMKKLIYESPVLNDPLFERLIDFGFSIAGNKELYSLKEDLKKPRKTKTDKNSVIKYNKEAEELYLTAPIGRLRFSIYDRITPDRKFLLVTEGKSDALIIEHAFIALTESNPYWEIAPIHESSGGATDLAKFLESTEKLIDEKKVIGIFDNDAKGIQEFKGLKTSKFSMYQDSKRIKKHLEVPIFALKLPIPPFRNNYYQEDQVFNFFSIEHYFSDELLLEHKMLETTPLNGIFKISSKGSAKTDFSKFVRTLTDKEHFQGFISLFIEIDKIFGVDEIDYLD